MYPGIGQKHHVDGSTILFNIPPDGVGSQLWREIRRGIEKVSRDRRNEERALTDSKTVTLVSSVGSPTQFLVSSINLAQIDSNQQVQSDVHCEHVMSE